MVYKKLENILLYILLVITGGVYLYTVAPTLSFWDCGEFIASAYTLAVPHPPGTPFYVFLGRVWLIIVGAIAAILPISKEVAWHMNLLGLGISVLTIFLLYRMLLKIFRMFQQGNDLNLIIIAFATCLGIAFFFTYWVNAIETEVYAASTFAVVLINYLAILWYESVKQGKSKNRYILLAFYLIFLCTGIHMTPFLIFIPFYIFIFFVERQYSKDKLFLLLGIFQLIFFALIFLLPPHMHLAVLFLLGLVLLIAIILPLSNPIKYRNWRFFWAGIFLILVAVSTELYLPLRARKLIELYQTKEVREKYLAGENTAPRINECNPGKDFTAFNNVLHRSQYGPQRIIPRQTQDATGYNLIEGAFWQFAHFIRYLSWQPVRNEGMNKSFRAVILSLFYLFGVWGMVELYRRERKMFLLLILIMFMLSFATIGYLNLKFSPSDSNPKHQPREVRERDYFFHAGYVYFGIFIGLGFLGLTNLLRKETKNNRLVDIGSLSGIVVFSVVPLFANIHVNNRYGDFIPKDYAYNMLSSCNRGAILFTNGDNDTFPLWFAQEVLGIRRDVIIANLSLINTDWYIKQLKYWGAPVSFSDFVIEQLQPFMTRDRRVIFVKDIMVRNILATNIKKNLNNEDYVISQTEFAGRFLKGYKGKRPIYFASTVSHENFEGYKPYLILEGLAYRVAGDSGDPIYNVDVEKTENFFYNTYRYTGVFEPDKQELLSGFLIDFPERKKEGEFYDFALQKDENTKRLYSNYAAGLHNLGIVLRERGDIKGTIDAWRFALLFEPEPAYFFNYNLGLLFADLGMVDSAEYYFSKIETKDPRLILQIGAIYRSTGYYNGAVEYIRRAINMNPRFSQAYYELYSTYLMYNDTASAIQVLYDWLRINPRDTSVINMLKELNKE